MHIYIYIYKYSFSSSQANPRIRFARGPPSELGAVVSWKHEPASLGSVQYVTLKTRWIYPPVN